VNWIKTVPMSEAEGELRRCYEAVYALYPPEYMSEVPAVAPTLPSPDPGGGQGGGSADSITAAHSLIPAALRHSLSTYGVLLDSSLPLTRRQHEMIATVVSVLNRCFY
jgi:hypothetical protein